MFKFIDSLSLKKIITLSVIVSSLLSIPLLVIYALNPIETTNSSASSVAGEPKIFKHTDPDGTTKISGIKPFWGKAGDEVVVWGENFGEFPINSYISIGSIKVTTYSTWEDNQIVFTIPQGASSGMISLTIGNSLLNWNKALNVFSSNTETILEYKSGKLTLLNYPQDTRRILVWQTINGQPEIFDVDKITSSYEVPKSFDRIEWVSVENSEGGSIPFLINPLSFDK